MVSNKKNFPFQRTLRILLTTILVITKKKLKANHKIFMPSMNILFNEAYKRITFPGYIEYQNFIKIHIAKCILHMHILVQQRNGLQIWLTLCLPSREDYNHTVTTYIHVVTSVMCGYFNTVKIFWIVLILVFILENCICPKKWLLQFTYHSSWKCINALKEIIYNAINC